MPTVPEVADVAAGTAWVTRREPVFREGPFAEDQGRAAVALVEERVSRGLPPRSVVSVTGLPMTEEMRRGGGGCLGAGPFGGMGSASDSEERRQCDGGEAGAGLWQTSHTVRTRSRRRSTQIEHAIQPRLWRCCLQLLVSHFSHACYTTETTWHSIRKKHIISLHIHFQIAHLRVRVPRAVTLLSIFIVVSVLRL